MSTNDITGARLVSRVNDKNYEDGYDRIFKKKSMLDEYLEASDELEKIKNEIKSNGGQVYTCIIHDNEKDIIND